MVKNKPEKEWLDHLTQGLERIGFVPSKVDECVFTRGSTMFMCYVDDGLFADKDEKNIDKAIKDLRDVGFDIENRGNIQDYLGIHVDFLPNNHIKLS